MKTPAAPPPSSGFSSSRTTPTSASSSRGLVQAGYDVRVATSSQNALDAYAEPGFTVDLIVTDVGLQSLSGIDLVSRLRAEHGRLAALFISGYPDGDRGHGMRLPDAAPFLQKPFSVTTFLTTIRRLLDAPR